ncbi:MAG: DUF4230 domain-containing protein [Paramuribaculum sp.]|nr:DUF4230 domain-containing protein [Paramuribaculum sp.]
MKIIYPLFALSIVLMSSCAKNNTNELYQELKSVDKMVLAKMSITKTVTMNKENPFGRRKAGYSYDTYARAFIDLSTLQAEDLVFNDQNQTVQVFLPPVEAELMGRDTDMHEVYTNITGTRYQLDEKDLTKLKEEGNESMRTEWEENPMFKAHLIESAKRKARKYFENIFEANGYVASIEFKNSEKRDNEKHN